MRQISLYFCAKDRYSNRAVTTLIEQSQFQWSLIDSFCSNSYYLILFSTLIKQALQSMHKYLAKMLPNSNLGGLILNIFSEDIQLES